MWNMFKVNNKDTRTTSMTPFDVFMVYFKRISQDFLVLPL